MMVTYITSSISMAFSFFDKVNLLSYSPGIALHLLFKAFKVTKKQLRA